MRVSLFMARGANWFVWSDRDEKWLRDEVFTVVISNCGGMVFGS